METSDKTAICNETDGQFKSRNWSLRHREHSLVIGSSRALHHPKLVLDVTCQTLPTLVDSVVDHEHGAVSLPRDLGIVHCSVDFVTLGKGHVIVIDLYLVEHFKLCVEDDEFAGFRCHGEILLVVRPCSSQDAAIDEAHLAPLLTLNEVYVATCEDHNHALDTLNILHHDEGGLGEVHLDLRHEDVAYDRQVFRGNSLSCGAELKSVETVL